jgi:uncharacterized membrane protein
MKLNIKIQFIFLVQILFFYTFVIAQGNYYNQKDDQYRLLGLKRAKDQYEITKANYEREQKLFEKQLISAQDLEQSKVRFADAEVNYQQALLAVIFENQYVTVVKAVKYQIKDGQKHVRLTLDNSSGGGAEFVKLINVDDKLYRTLQPDVINNVYVSLLNNENAIISQPYEIKIDEIRFGKPVTIDFIMLQDLDAVTVSMIYGNGTQRSRKIFLQKDATVNKVIVQSEQFSQEVELGKSASFGLTLELFSGLNNTFKLEVVNLPKQINKYFTDPITKARLNQFKFTESTNTKRADLQVFLPDRPIEGVEMDKPISFYVLVVPIDEADGVQKMLEKELSLIEIQNLNVGFVKLEIVPRGSGKLLVRAPQLYFSILPDETVEMSIEVVNEGSRRLDNIEVQADPPLNWSKEVEPRIISSLDIREEKKVTLRFKPTEGTSVGKYEVRLRTTSYSDNQPVNAEDKTVSIEIRAKSNVFFTALIIILIIGLVLGIVIFGIRLSKK